MTSPLPRVRSTNWAIRAWKTNCLMLIFAEALSRIKPFESQWTVKDSNLRKLLLSDLQSDPVGHLGNRPYFIEVAVNSSVPSSCSWLHWPVYSWADNGARTHDLPLTRRPLCQLSYVGGFQVHLPRTIVTGIRQFSKEFIKFSVFALGTFVCPCHKNELYTKQKLMQQKTQNSLYRIFRHIYPSAPCQTFEAVF